MFASYLRSQGPQAQSGHIIDATLIPIPWQRNIREENKGINPGKLPDSRDENQDRLQKKDLDSHLVQKNDINYYVNKKSICNNIDRGYTLHYAATTR